MKKIIITFLTFIPIITFANLEEKIDKILNTKNDIYKKEQLLVKLDKYLKDKEENEKIIELKIIISNKLESIKKEIEIEEEKVQKIILWYTQQNTPITAYYRWNPNKSFFWIFANIHWGYEYGTYNTALEILDSLEKSNKKQWFIIPTINPDWLKIAKNQINTKSYFLEWRWNSNNIDLNRNFCTPDWKSWEFKKRRIDAKEDITLSRWEYCMDQKESQIIDETLKKYKFSEIIDLHSKWWIIFIPDYGLDDYRVVNLWNRVKSILNNNYIFNPYYENENQKSKKIKTYEINERYTDSYPWSMITYIYYKYNIPSIILELKEHWQIEYDLKKIETIF